MKIELLAPVGTLENFQAALNGGADAVYVGAPKFNARNPARELTHGEIQAIVDRSHQLGKKVYFAVNSLILEQELPEVIASLALFAKMDPDALIVQDFGLVNLARRYFPELKLHGSTLMTVHNSEGVRELQHLGFERAVLARELTLKEIETITRRSGDMQLEIFIHGAMCFSFSGLCIFSSYLGGRSGLRGRCVQPCRRAYSTTYTSGCSERGNREKTRKGKYLFSMNDLNGLEAVSTLAQLGVSSLKIEGRLRSANYVETVVRAYRTVLDALQEDGSEGPDFPQALAEGERLSEMALSRRTESGYFFSPQPAEAITPMVSGNMGTHLGRFTTVKTGGGVSVCRLTLQGSLRRGDRLRLHLEPSGERIAFRLKQLFVGAEEREEAVKGERASLQLPPNFTVPETGHIEVFRVDGAPVPFNAGGMHLKEAQEKVDTFTASGRREVERIIEEVGYGQEQFIDEPAKGRQRERLREKSLGVDWWLKVDHPEVLSWRFPFTPDRLLFSFEKKMLVTAGKLRRDLGKRSRTVIWALPPLFMENDLSRIRKQINILIRTGFRSFQLSHPSQIHLFGRERVHLFGNYTLNVMNSVTAQFYAGQGLEGVMASIELDRISLSRLLDGVREMGGQKPAIGMQVYGAPALYTSRLNTPFPLEKELLSPRDEPFVVHRKEGFTITCPTRPFSLLPAVEELKALGVNYFVVDTCGHSRKKDLEELSARLSGNGRYGKLPTFNYFGKLE
ncbi:U32 family peptidase [Desulforhopalus vacuolatus]|uniref:peptidase U32 family protein n=1 Tax=Desulforhopalus vacuolatus TaxID=40414 RepID=UPI0019636550|nr:peptidase U32 family protein [Desulforhopalus vacuolatus]MBM9520489.1 U32 family peptidase [Desulforhopalus vacuolatus]